MTTLPSTYKAYVYEKYGPIDQVLSLKNVPMEPLEPTFVRIRIHCVALNPADHLIAEGAGERILNKSPSPEDPFRLGFDASGVIVEVGTQVGDKFQVGDEVYAITPLDRMETLAEYVTLDVKCIAHKPKSLDFIKAAAVPGVSLTSYQGLIDQAKLQPRERMLILGGSTCVGMYAIQHAKAIGAYVIATASTKKVEYLKSLGADEVIDYTTTKWINIIVPHSLDVVFDCGVEPQSWDNDAQVVLKKEGSRFVTVLPGPPSTEAKFGATYSFVFCYESGSQLESIGNLIDEGKITPIVDSVFPFEKAVEALVLLKSRRVLGKVVIQVVEEQPVKNA